jgi:hypothetical protein
MLIKKGLALFGLTFCITFLYDHTCAALKLYHRQKSQVEASE